MACGRVYWQRQTPHSDPKTESHQSGRKLSDGGASASVVDSKKGSHGGWHS